MAMNDQLRTAIKELSNKARSGSSNWERLNPSTFRLIQDEDGSYLTLQRVDASTITELLGGIQKYHYVLQAVKDDVLSGTAEDSKKILFKLNSADREEYKDILKELFDAIYSGIEMNVANMLGNFIK